MLRPAPSSTTRFKPLVEDNLRDLLSLLDAPPQADPLAITISLADHSLRRSILSGFVASIDRISVVLRGNFARLKAEKIRMDEIFILASFRLCLVKIGIQGCIRNFREIFGKFLQDSRTMIGSGNRIVRKKLEEM